MGLITQLDSRTSSILYDEIEDAHVARNDNTLTNLLAQDITLERDLVFPNRKDELSEREAFVYNQGPAHGENITAFSDSQFLDDGRVLMIISESLIHPMIHIRGFHMEKTVFHSLNHKSFLMDGLS